MKIKRKLSDLPLVGGNNISDVDVEVEIELTKEEIMTAYESIQDGFLRSDAMHHLSERLSYSTVTSWDSDITEFLKDLDEEYKTEFKEKYGISIGEALEPQGYDLLGKLVAKYDDLYASEVSDWDRWEDAVDIELQNLENLFLESKGPYTYLLTQKVSNDDDGWFPKGYVLLNYNNSCIRAENCSPIGFEVSKDYISSGVAYGTVSYKLPVSEYMLKDYPLVPWFNKP